MSTKKKNKKPLTFGDLAPGEVFSYFDEGKVRWLKAIGPAGGGAVVCLITGEILGAGSDADRVVRRRKHLAK